jgi:cystathionine gamma-synthase
VQADRATIWPYDKRGEPGRFFYSRYAHPTGAAAEERLGALEHGDALLYSSGMGAATTIILAFARPGMRIALAEGSYYGTSLLIRDLARWGIDLVEYDQTTAPPAAEIVWVEAPANPILTMPDWDALRAHPGLVVCDATLSTPVYLNALAEEVDVVLHSATKYLCGHHDALLGATVTRDRDQTARLLELRGRAGLQSAPDAAAALLRGLDSLEERMQRITATASEIARRLAAHDGVTHVRYPGFSGVISFDVEDARTVETRTKLIVNATSLGGETSTLESRHRWEGDRVPPGLIRLSVGLEAVDALWSDLGQALA